MKVATLFKGTLHALMVASLLAAGQSWADDDDRGGGGRGRGGGEGSSRSSGGGERSSSGGGQRSSQSVNRGGEGSSRSSSRGSERSMRSSSGESGRSSRSYSEGSGSGSTRQYSRPSDGDSRSSSGQSRNQAYEGTRSGRNLQHGNSQSGSSLRSGQQDGARPTYNPSTRGAFRTEQSGNRSGANQGRQQFNQGGQQNNQGAQQYQARRANEEEVRDFLQLRGDNSQRQAGGNTGDRGDFRDGRSIRGDGDEARRADIARRLGDSNRSGQDVNRNVGDPNRANREVSDNLRNRERDLNGNQDFADRDRGNRDGDRDYQRWREGAGRDRDDDHRDWSGKWRDGDRFASARTIRNHWRDRDDDDYPFHGGWWDRDDHWHGHHGHHWDWWGDYAHSHHRPYYWWTWSTAPRLTSWVSFGWDRPYYWDYGPGEYIYYDDGVVYVNGRWYQPAPVFYDRTVQIVERAPELTPEDAAQLDWLPLGVFAVMPDGAAQADVLVQLAVTNDGVIGGTAFNQRNDAAYPIQGMVDKQTQRAVWSYNNERQQRIVMESSIYNLTQPEATGLVHHGPDDFRVVQLVRLEEPASGAAATASGELPAP